MNQYADNKILSAKTESPRLANKPRAVLYYKAKRTVTNATVLFFTLLVKIVLLLELVNTSACVNQLLLSCKERVALRADFNLYILLG